MPLPKTVPNPYNESHRQVALRILAKLDHCEPVLMSMQNIGVNTNDLLNTCAEIRELATAFLAEFFPD